MLVDKLLGLEALANVLEVDVEQVLVKGVLVEEVVDNVVLVVELLIEVLVETTCSMWPMLGCWLCCKLMCSSGCLWMNNLKMMLMWMTSMQDADG